MRLNNAEKETIICFDEETPTASVYTFNNQLKKRLAALHRKHPDIFRLTHENTAVGCAEYAVPIGLLVVKFTEPMSEEKREIFRAAAKKRTSRV